MKTIRKTGKYPEVQYILIGSSICHYKAFIQNKKTWSGETTKSQLKLYLVYQVTHALCWFVLLTNESLPAQHVKDAL